jgi:hypothetical protein
MLSLTQVGLAMGYPLTERLALEGVSSLPTLAAHLLLTTNLLKIKFLDGSGHPQTFQRLKLRLIFKPQLMHKSQYLTQRHPCRGKHPKEFEND